MPKRDKGDSAIPPEVAEALRKVEGLLRTGASGEEAKGLVISLLQRYPQLVTTLIDPLAKVTVMETARLLEGLLEVFEQKRIRKAIKRGLYLLREKGVVWEEKKGGSVLRPAPAAGGVGYVGGVDGFGERVVVVGLSRQQGGVRAYVAVISDRKGLLRLEGVDTTKKGIQGLVAEVISHAALPAAEAPAGYCAHLIRVAAQRTDSLPPGYVEAKARLADLKWNHPLPLIYSYLPEEEVIGKEALLKGSASLHRIFPFSTWFLDGEGVRRHAEAIAQAEATPIFLTPQQKDERLASLYQQAYQELFPEEERLLWKGRLEEMAYLLWKHGKQREAQEALAAAVDLKGGLRTTNPNPFCWGLLVKSIYAYLEAQAKARQASLIVTP